MAERQAAVERRQRCAVVRGEGAAVQWRGAQFLRAQPSVRGRQAGAWRACVRQEAQLARAQAVQAAVWRQACAGGRRRVRWQAAVRCVQRAAGAVQWQVCAVVRSAGGRCAPAGTGGLPVREVAGCGGVVRRQRRQIRHKRRYVRRGRDGRGTAVQCCRRGVEAYLQEAETTYTPHWHLCTPQVLH